MKKITKKRSKSRKPCHLMSNGKMFKLVPLKLIDVPDGEPIVKHNKKEVNRNQKITKLLESIVDYNTVKLPLKKIISGGQPGVELAVLNAAKEYSIECTGFAPEGYVTLTGKNTDLKRFGLVELKDGDFISTTMKNIDISNGSVIIRTKNSEVLDKLVGYAQTKKYQRGLLETLNKNETKFKPICVVTDVKDEKKIFNQMIKFIYDNKLENVYFFGTVDSDFLYQKKIMEIIMRFFKVIEERINK